MPPSVADRVAAGHTYTEEYICRHQITRTTRTTRITRYTHPTLLIQGRLTRPSHRTRALLDNLAAMTRPWWELDPDRYQDELEQLRRAGIRFERDEAAFRAGRLQLTLYPVVSGEVIELIATFPDLYPWFRFEIQAPALNLPYHQHALAKTLCFLPRDTSYWYPESDRLAAFLTDRLNGVLAAGGYQSPHSAGDRDNEAGPTDSSDEPAGAPEKTGFLEEEQAEPFSDYYMYQPETSVMLDGAWRIPAELTHGTLIVGLAGGGRPEPALRGVVLRVLDEHGDNLFPLEEALKKQYPVELRVPWVRLKAPIEPGSAAEIYARVREALRALDPGADTQALPVRGGVIRVRAGLFEEEHRPRSAGPDRFGDGWIFPVSFDPGPPNPGAKKSRSRPGRRSGRATVTHYLARPTRGGRKDLAARVPELRALAGKRIAVFGLGCLGAPSALEFARGSVRELRLLDDDFVDPAATGRWPFGLAAAGLFKVKVLQQFIQAHYPYTQVRGEIRRLGAVHHLTAEDISRQRIPEDDQAVIDRMLQDVDLVYDASAELGVQYFLASEARARGIPYIGASGTQGGWGGVVLRIFPGHTEGCWICYRYHCMKDIPAPPELETGRVQPTGCGNPTFTGANFDLGEVALMGVRIAAATLSVVAGTGAAYPPASWDLAVLALRDSSGALVPPTWQTYPLRRHPDCPHCRAEGRDQPLSA